ncbi:MAG: hypothetical protein V4543_16050 [Bacteroidota bacterium]
MLKDKKSSSLLKVIFALMACIAFAACTGGYYLPGGQYRSKNAVFKPSGKKFRYNPLVDCRHLYLSKTPFTDPDSILAIAYLGFYPDGRMITGTVAKTAVPGQVSRFNSYDSSAFIGTYFTDEDNINTRFYYPSEGGTYVFKEGKIKPDTLIIIENIMGRNFNVSTRFDTLVRSAYPLR